MEEKWFRVNREIVFVLEPQAIDFLLMFVMRVVTSKQHSHERFDPICFEIIVDDANIVLFVVSIGSEAQSSANQEAEKGGDAEEPFDDAGVMQSKGLG